MPLPSEQLGPEMVRDVLEKGVVALLPHVYMEIEKRF
jgi:hypothetical protein